MNYYKIYNNAYDAWLTQDQTGYTDEEHAGFWPEPATLNITLNEWQKAIFFSPSSLTLRLIELGMYDFCGRWPTRP